jgi:hypothetical protein
MGLALHPEVRGFRISSVKEDVRKFVSSIKPGSFVVPLVISKEHQRARPAGPGKRVDIARQRQSPDNDSATLNQAYDMLDRLVTELPADPDGPRGVFCQSGFVIGIERKVGDRVERWQRDTPLDFDDELGE